MSTTTLLGMTYVEASQAGKYAVINTDLDIVDAALGSSFGYTTQTAATYTILKTDYTVLLNHSAAHTATLPATTGASAPRAGQKFLIKDICSSGAGTYNITIAVPSGKKLDGVTNGTLVLAADRAWAEIIFVSDTLGYYTVRAKGVMTANDLLRKACADLLMVAGSNAVAIPASNNTPSWIPFVFAEDVGIDAIVFPFGTAAPTSDATDAKIRFCFYESGATFLPATIRYASEDFKLQGSGHVRSSAIGYGNVGGVVAAVGLCVLSARRYFKGNTLYFLGMHYENTFAGATTIEVNRGVGPGPVKFGSTQAWPYTFANTPSVGAQYSADDELRPDIVFRFRRIADIY